MWGLDRLASHTAPQNSPPTSRPYSPAPRRSNLGPGRPPLNPRESSLSLASSNSSYQNLPATARLPPVKRQLPVAPPADVEDPLAALERIVGKALGDAAIGTSIAHSARKPSTVDSDIVFDELSLEDFAARAEVEDGGAHRQAEYSQHSVEEYGKDREKFEDLHKSITACDEVLQSVEKYLSSFQSDLGAVSAEIESLQTRSTTLNERLQNRQKVERLLGPVVDRITLPGSLVKKLTEGPIDDAWIRSLGDLQHRAEVLSSATDLKDLKAVHDLKPIVEDLSKKAVERIRDYFATQIRSLRSPNINAQIIQHRAFLRYQPLYAYLATRQPQLAEELLQAYANTMRWYYNAHFVRYQASLNTLRLYTTDKHDVLGEDPTSAPKPRGATTIAKTDNFSIARRNDIIRSPSTTALPSHAAEDSKATHHIETPYLALNLALIDNASFEYIFMTAFFSNQPLTTSGTPSVPILASNHTSLTRAFNTIFAPVISIASALTKTLISETYDALGVLLMIRINQHLAFTLQRRKVPTLDAYVNGTNMLLWPRLQSILDANCTSLKHLASSLPNRAAGPSNAAGTLATLSGSAPAGGLSTAPHPVTQRFANLVKGIIDLSSEAGDDEPISNSLARLRGEFEAFLTKLGASFGSGERAKKEKGRLLSNNYSLVLAVLADTKGRLAQETKARFEENM